MAEVSGCGPRLQFHLQGRSGAIAPATPEDPPSLSGFTAPEPFPGNQELFSKFCKCDELQLQFT